MGTCRFCGAIGVENIVVDVNSYSCGTDIYFMRNIYERSRRCYETELANLTAALWKIIDDLRLVDQYNLMEGQRRFTIRGILEKYGVPIPEGKEVW